MSSPQLFDRVWETSTTTGTGTFTVSGARTGFRAFSAVGNGTVVSYTITDGTAWELGEGTYSSNTLTRDKVYSSSNSNSLVEFGAGTKDVILSIPSNYLTQINVENTFITAEPISGGRAVGFNSSGAIQIAMHGVANRQTAVGVVIDNVASGLSTRVYNRGRINSNLFNFSGYMGRTVFVGQSGELITSGAPVLSGTVQQPLGVVTSHSGMFITPVVSGALLTSGNIASGQIGGNHIASGGILSGHIASGQIGVNHVAAGAIRSGHLAATFINHEFLASGAVLSGNVASGQLGSFHIASGGVLSGNIASGQIGQFHHASGSVHGAAGTGQHVASGTIGSFDIGSGAIISGRIASGQIGQNHIANTSIIGSHIAAATINASKLGSGAVVSGTIASGQIGGFHIANGGVLSGNVASGILHTYHLSSGATATRSQFAGPFVSGTSWTCLTEEIISGVRAVAISQSGRLRVAMAAVSGRMPAIGIVVDNVASGIQANVYTEGVFQVTSGLNDFSGSLGLPTYVGRSGQIVQTSGSWNSGGFSSGDVWQRVGVPLNSGSLVIHMSEAYRLASG